VHPVPDTRKHRGPHPADAELFSAAAVAALKAAVAELSWLLSRGYAVPSALKLVGDRHGLRQRQRLAVARCACGDQALARRQASQVALRSGERIWIDGFNVLLTLEVALGGGPVFIARDGCVRDIASVHGSYRQVSETPGAVELLARRLRAAGVRGGRVLLDAPVSNSGRLAHTLRKVLQGEMEFSVELVPNPDLELKGAPVAVASADSGVIDHVSSWVNLVRLVLEEASIEPWWVDLEGAKHGPASPLRFRM